MLTLVVACAGAGLLVVAGVLVGCPPNPNVECSSQNDCPIGKACNAQQKCVDQAPPPPPLDGGPGRDAGFEGEGEGGGGEGEGEGGQNATVQTLAPVTMFVADPANPAAALLGIETAGVGGLDEELPFDPTAGTIGTTVVFDFSAKLSASCGIDTIFTLPASVAGTLPGAHQKETWFSCGTPSPHVFIEYDADTGNLFTNTGVTAAEVTRLLGPYVHDNLSSTKRARIVTAARGGSLQIITADTANDSLATTRASTAPTFSDGTTLTKVEQIFVLSFDDITFGDVLLVFDRGTAPKLVPIQRELNTDTWHGAPINNAPLLKNVTLPTDVTAVVFREDQFDTQNLNQLNVDQTTQNIANLVTIRPRLASAGGFGEVDFDRYETVVKAATPATSTSGFQTLHLRAGDQPAAPLDRDRTLLQTVRSGPDLLVYYALTQSNHVWRFPIHKDLQDQRDNDVARAGGGFLQTGDKPNGLVLVPGDLNDVWLSFSSTARASELDRVSFQSAF